MTLWSTIGSLLKVATSREDTNVFEDKQMNAYTKYSKKLEKHQLQQFMETIIQIILYLNYHTIECCLVSFITVVVYLVPSFLTLVDIMEPSFRNGIIHRYSLVMPSSMMS